MKKGTGFLTLFGGAVALYALLAAPVSMRAQETETIEDGVYIGNIYVGGMTEEEAVSAVEAYVESAESAEMTLKTGDKSVSVTAADLGISFSNLNVVDEAIDVGRSGNLIKRYKDKKDLQQGDKVIALSLDVDSDAVASILSGKAAQLNQEAVDNGLVRENGAFKIIKGEQGIEVNVEDSIAAIENYISSEWDGGNAEIELVAEVVEPRGSEEDLEQITDMMGSYTTNYKDSPMQPARSMVHCFIRARNFPSMKRSDRWMRQTDTNWQVPTRMVRRLSLTAAVCARYLRLCTTQSFWRSLRSRSARIIP